MTTSQSFRIYELLQKHFNSAEDAKIIVQEIEDIVEKKIEAKKDTLSTKEDLLNSKMDLIDRIHKAKIETIIWIVGVGILQFILTLISKKFM